VDETNENVAGLDLPLEFMCWTMVVLAPILSWINGPSVSTDQYVVRTAVFALALTGGIVLRLAKMLRRMRGD
jgi:hypothetical protein